MPDSRSEWARAYALQALSDLRARDAAARANLEKCHRLHFLQMAAEKACKAYLTSANGHESVRKTHAYVERVLPILARAFYSSEQDNQGIPAWQIKQIKRFAREIEVIAPACDAGDVREDNSEYPWLDGNGIVQTPCLHSFPHLDDGNRVVILLIRLIRIAAESYTR
jgi:hypothetical protein